MSNGFNDERLKELVMTNPIVRSFYHLMYYDNLSFEETLIRTIVSLAKENENLKEQIKEIYIYSIILDK